MKTNENSLSRREFYYIQMEKFARDAVADDRIQCKEDIVVSSDFNNKRPPRADGKIFSSAYNGEQNVRSRS